MEKVIAYLQQLYPVSGSMEAELRSVLHFSKIKKNEFLHSEGRIPRTAWYLQKGLVRCYYERDYREVTIWFIGEDNAIILFKALSAQKKSLYHVQAVEDCELYSIHYHDLQILLNKYPEARRLHTILSSRYGDLHHQKIRATSMLSPMERYRYFEKHFPHLPGRIKLDHIASYLNMDTRTLTRVRKNRQR
jgi:CRP-like cAMP-binding protein